MSEYVFVASSGERIPVVIESQRGRRNITLRPKVCPVREIRMSRPWMASDRAAINFLESKRKWVERIFDKAPKKECLAPGAEIDFLGRSVKLLHDAGRRGNDFRLIDNNHAVLTVGGAQDMFERRIRDFIKAEFLKEVKAIIRTVPRDFWPRRIALRDTTSRWGSCSTSGTMSFSWRLAFAPVEVMRYVVMHELAHQKHMDHSPEFWAQVRDLYGFGVERAKRWLNQHGAELHRWL